MKEEFDAVKHSFDLVLNTVSTSLDWSAYLDLLAYFGVWNQVGATLAPISVSAVHLLMKRISVTGTGAGSPSEIQEMLYFAEKHNILPLIETMPLADANKALERVATNQARFRVVLEI